MLVNRGGYATPPRAPGHDRPRTAPRAVRHGRLSAATRAPGADVPLTTTARAPGQYCLSAAHWAPGPSRRHALTAWAVAPDRLSATLLAPGAAALRAITAPVSGQYRLRATCIATAPPPAGQSRRRQGSLLGAAATPNTLTYPHVHRDTTHTRTTHSPRYQPSCPPLEPSFPPAHPSFPSSHRSFPRQRQSPAPRRHGETAGPLRTGHRQHVYPHAQIRASPLHHPSRATCPPRPARPAVLLHRHNGRPPPSPLPRPAAAAAPLIAPQPPSFRRKPESTSPELARRRSGAIDRARPPGHPACRPARHPRAKWWRGDRPEPHHTWH